MLRKSSGPLRPWRRLRQASRQLARQRVQRLAQHLHLVARGVHELDVLGQRLAQRLGHRLGTPVGDQPATDLRLDLALEAIDAALVLLAFEALLERGQLATDLPPRVASISFSSNPSRSRLRSVRYR